METKYNLGQEVLIKAKVCSIDISARSEILPTEKGGSKLQRNYNKSHITYRLELAECDTDRVYMEEDEIYGNIEDTIH